MLTVNLTTTHSRLHLCSATVWSLMNQSLKPDFIVLWVSRDSYLSDEGIKQTPDIVQKFNTINNIIVVNYVSNTGPYRKIIPALRKGNHSDIMVYADDDVIYGYDWLKTLVDCFNRYDRKCVVASRVRIIDKNIFGSTKSYSSFDISTSEEKYNERFIITGVGGAILTKDLIDSQYLNDDSFIVVAPKTDDIWISKIIELSGTSVVSCPQALSQVHEIQHSNSSLSSQNTLFSKQYGPFKYFVKLQERIFSYFGLLNTNNDKSLKNTNIHFQRKLR